MNPDKKIRRLQSLLYTSGAGTVLFSIWSGIRGIALFFEELREKQSVWNEILNNEVAGILVFFLMLCIICVYVYIGRKAMMTSLGRKTSNNYIVLSILLVISSAKSYISDFFTLAPSEWIHTGGIVLSVIDFTSLVILAEVAVFSILLKKLR